MRRNEMRTVASRGRRLLAGVCLAGIVALSAAAGSQAKVLHKYQPPQITGVPSEPGVALPGKPAVVDSMTVEGGDLFTTETMSTGGNNRTDVYDASTMRFLAQFPVSAPGSRLREGIGVSDAFPERRAYVGGKDMVAVYTESAPQKWELAATWSGNATPAKHLTESNTDVAVDNEGDVYVADSEAGVVDVFEPQGDPSDEVLVARIEGTGPGKPFTFPYHVAVDHATGDVAVVDSIPTGTGVNQDVVDMFAPEPGLHGAYRALFTLTGPSPSTHFTNILSVVIGAGGAAAGNIFVVGRTVGNSAPGVYEFEPTGAYLDEITGSETPEGTFYAHGIYYTGEPRVVSVDPAAPYSLFVSPRYQGQGEYGVVDRFGDDVVVPDVSTSSGPEVRLDSAAHAWVAAVGGSVDPAGAGPATCAFVWGVGEAFDESSSCVGPGEESDPIPNGNSVAPVTGDLRGLASDTSFEYRLQASNANGVDEGESSEGVSFSTPGPGIHGVWAADVSSDAARLAASIDPDEPAARPHPVSCFFEYGLSTSYGSTLAGGAIGPGTADVQVQGEARGLAASSVYHYRVVVTAEVEAEPTAKPGVFVTERFYGPDQTFTTQASASTGPLLPDGRAWELVSPTNKHGGLIAGLNQIGLESAVQASVSGDAISYASVSPIGEGVAGNDSPWRDQVYSHHGPGGWSSRGLVPPHASEVGLNDAVVPEYQFFSEDLSLGLLDTGGDEDQTLLSPYASEPTPYVREQAACEDSARAESECYLPLLSGKEGYADVVSGTKFGEPHSVKFEDATGNMDHIVLESTDELTEAGTYGHEELYEWSREAEPSKRLQMVSVLPREEGGGPSLASAVKPGNNGATIWRSGPPAITSNGSRIFWTASGARKDLYLRDVARGETIKLNTPMPGVEAGTPEASFEGMNENGSIAYFTDSERLTPDASSSGADLYECRIVEGLGGLECELEDLTPEGADGPTEVQNIALGSSTDGSYIYFVANGKLGSNAPRGVCGPTSTSVGTCNLFMYHEGATRLVATLSAEDEADWGESKPIFDSLGNLTARVSPNGRFVVFMSSRSLTGYDNDDVLSGKPDQEVYLYDAVNERLACVSCNPSGARPQGVEAQNASPLTVQARQLGSAWKESSWVSGSIPTGDQFGSYGESLYMPRVLFDSGRAFFDSRDALVPGDVNHEEDVYEYEPVGVPAGQYACSTSSSAYSVRDEGCVSLISSGRAPGGAGFLDASASGDDVFFATAEPLVDKDVDTAVDVYDAHVCGVGWECEAETASPPPCASGDACRGAPAPQPTVFGAPSSATFKGQGNAPAAAGKTPVKPKRLTRAQKLRRALKACRRKRSEARRGACRRAAHRRYGPAAKAKARARARPRRGSAKGARAGVAKGASR